MKHTIALIISCTMAVFACTQTPKPTNSLDQVFEDMHRQMLRGMPDNMKMDTIRPGQGQTEFFQYSPDSSSYFYFKIDTSFGGGGMGSSQFFRFSPFGDRGGNMSDPFGMPSMEQMMKEMERMQQEMFGRGGFGMMPPPSAEPEESEDGLLPEERLRQQEEKAKTPSNGATPAPTTPATPAKPKIKTTRI